MIVPAKPRQARCAVYTRKSTDHNLDLEFNSLDAQREACEAYIKSQAHEGWSPVPGRYDDGGLSGGSLDRPALQALLTDTRKKGVRYRYYISQALAQFRKEDAGEVSRVSAPEIESVIGAFLEKQHAGIAVSKPISREALQRHIRRITIKREGVVLEPLKSLETLRGQHYTATDLNTVVLPLGRKFPESAQADAVVHDLDPRSHDVILTAIEKSRLWLDELTKGKTFTEIAQREGKGERQIRLLTSLAFASPGIVQALIARTAHVTTITHTAKNMPLIWPEKTRTRRYPLIRGGRHHNSTIYVRFAAKSGHATIHLN